MQGADDVVDHGEEEPGQVEAGGEHEDAVAPARVQQRGVEIAEVPPPLLGDVLVGDACAAALLHHPLPLVHLALLIVCLPTGPRKSCSSSYEGVNKVLRY